jgi:hypothetical protein
MKYILRIKMPNTKANEVIKDPEFGTKMKQVLEDVKAETAYFTTIDGLRGGYVVVNLNDPSELPRVSAPFFLWLDAEVEIQPIMTIQDLGKAAPYIQEAARKYTR